MFRKKGAIVRTKRYGKLVRLSVIFAAVAISAGLIAYGWQEYEEKKYPEGTEKDYSLPNAFLDFARLINDFINQNVEEDPENPFDNETSEPEDAEDSIIIVGSSDGENSGPSSEDEPVEPEIRGGIVPEGKKAEAFDFRRTLFVGDYFIYQAENLGLFEYSDYASVTGLDMNTMLTKKMLRAEEKNVILSDYVASLGEYEAVYVTISAESISWMDVPTFVKKYTAFMDSIIAAQPNAHIYIHPVLPINEEKAEKRGYSVTNEKIETINEYIIAYAEENSIWILDMADEFKEKNGYLPADYTTNGIRFEKTTYEIWVDYILKHKAH